MAQLGQSLTKQAMSWVIAGIDSIDSIDRGARGFVGCLSRARRGMHAVHEGDAQGRLYIRSPLRQNRFSLEGLVDLVTQRPLNGTGDDGRRENWFWKCGTGHLL